MLLERLLMLLILKCSNAVVKLLFFFINMEQPLGTDSQSLMILKVDRHIHHGKLK